MKKIVCMFFLLAMFFYLPAYAEETEYIYTASVDGVCSIYISPSVNSYELMQVPACSKTELLKTDGTWNQIKYKNNVGWINSLYTRSSYKNAAMVTGFDEKKTIQVYTGENTARMYKVPLGAASGNDNEGVALPDGTILEMLRKTPSGWGLVSVNNEYMWIDTAYTRAFEGKVDEKQYGPYYVYITSDDGNGADMWESPEKEKSLAVIPVCTKLMAREAEGDYIYVSYKGMNGWVETAHTEVSLFNAQMKSGIEVMKECVIDSAVYGDDIQILSAPSYDEDVAASVLGTVEEEDSVLILRTIHGEWNLVFANGILGWLPPESIIDNPIPDEKVSVTVYENPKAGFVSTSDGNGIILFSDVVDSIETGVIPETVNVWIIAEKNGYKYVCCEYGAGWTENAEITSDYETALTKYATDTEPPYIINQDTYLMSIPAEKGFYGSKGIIPVKKNLKVTPLRIVETSDSEWALAEIDGTLGWIDLSHMDSTEFPLWEVLWAAAAIVVVLLAFSVWIKRKRAKKTQESRGK